MRGDHITALTRLLWAAKLDYKIFEDFIKGLADKSAGCQFVVADVKGDQLN